jgi:uncharacterized membrane protein
MGLLDRVKGILLSPKTEWEVIAGEQPNPGQIIVGYVLPLALIPAVATVIGMGVIGMGPFGSVSYGIAMGVVSFVTSLIGVYLTALVVDLLAPTFGSEKDFGRSLQLVAYSWTPAWVAGILSIVPALAWLGMIAGLYGIYLMYLGLPPIKKTPQDKQVVYLIVSFVVLMVVYFVIAAILTGIVAAILGMGIMTLQG